MIKQYDYITVYKSDETDFSHNGLRILCPTDCKITETLNGEYSITLTHPFDELGNWQFLIEYNILKVQGQLFRIYRKNTSMTSDGTKERTVDALHIFYDLNFYYISDCRPVQKNGPDALAWIMSHTYTRRGNGHANAKQPNVQFSFFSDIYGDNRGDPPEDLQYRHTAYYVDMTPTKALIGADNCFTNVWGGELIRDNFNVTINKMRGKINAFDIRYSVNMLEIDQDVDYSDYCEAVIWTGTYKYTDVGEEKEQEYKGIATLTRLNMPALPIIPMKSVKLTVKQEDMASNPTTDDIKKAFEKAARDYMLTNCSPIVNYRVSFANLTDYDLYKDFINLQSCDLGDIGTIYNDKLGINTTQQIVKKTIDGITGDVLSIELGSLRKSFTSDGKVNGGYDSVRTELIKNEISSNNTWENLGNDGYTLTQLDMTWDELSGNVAMEEV